MINIAPLKSFALHALCAIICLLSAACILFPSVGGADLEHLAPMGILVSLGLSTLLAILLIFLHLMRLENKRAFFYLLNYIVAWLLFSPALIALCVWAELPPLLEEEEQANIVKKEVFEPEDHLLGISSLVFNIYHKDVQVEHIQTAPKLLKLEQQHPDIFKKYIQTSPRWKHAQSDTFYAQLGHVEMVLHDKNDEHMGVVHVTFLELVEGDAMPKGYLSIKPGEKLPELQSKGKGVSDIALDLGGNYFLLLAWRGSADETLGRQAINNAIAFLDAKFDTLAKNPTEAQIKQLLQSDKSLPGNIPMLKLSQAPSQFGTYQAEIYANPGEPGLLILIIKDAKTKHTLRVLNSFAHYSDRKGELFLHEIPADLPDWMERQAWISEDSILAPKLPFFTIAKGQADESFNADFELWFAPSQNSDNLKHLLTKRYQVNNCDEQSFKESADKEIETRQELEDIPAKPAGPPPAGPPPAVKTVIVPKVEKASNSTKDTDKTEQASKPSTEKETQVPSKANKEDETKPVLAPAPPVEKLSRKDTEKPIFELPTKALDLPLPNFELLKRSGEKQSSEVKPKAPTTFNDSTSAP